MNTRQVCFVPEKRKGRTCGPSILHHVSRQRYAAALMPASITLGST